MLGLGKSFGAILWGERVLVATIVLVIACAPLWVMANYGDVVAKNWASYGFWVVVYGSAVYGASLLASHNRREHVLALPIMAIIGTVATMVWTHGTASDWLRQILMG